MDKVVVKQNLQDKLDANQYVFKRWIDKLKVFL